VRTDQNYISSSGQFKKYLASPNFVSVALGVVIATLVCFPFFHPGRLLLLDWAINTNTPLLSNSFYGLNGGLTVSLLPSLTISLTNALLGGMVTWIPLFMFFPLASLSIGKLVGGGNWRRVAAGTLFTINPFVYNRIFVGHIPLLLGYALLPFAISTLFNSAIAEKYQWTKVVLWWFVLSSLSPHFAWIFGVPFGVVFLFELYARRQNILRSVQWFLFVISTYLVSISYMLVPSLFTSLSSTIGTISLHLYATAADPILGLIPNTLGMYGFWRIGPGPTLPKNHFPGWFFLFLLLLIVASTGFGRSKIADDSYLVSESRNSLGSLRNVLRGQLRSNQKFVVVGLVGLFGLFLSLGNQGPTGALFSFFYNKLSFFQLMREPQKFLMLWVASFSVFYAYGAEKVFLILKSKGLQTVAAVALCLGLPIAYTPTMFAGLSNQISISSVPAAYQQADKLMGPGQGQILYLPWHIYISYPFASNRVVANIAAGAFTRSVISGDNVESGGVSTQSNSARSAFLEELYAKGLMNNNFGLLVEPLGVQYIVLTKSADWTSYSWLSKQADLKLVADNSSLSVWENSAFISANTSDTSKGLYSNGHRVIEQSPVAYEISSGKPGIVTTDIPYQKGWTFEGKQTSASSQGLVQVDVGEHGGILRFNPWNAVLTGYIISGGMVLALITTVFFGKRHRTSKKDKAI